MRDCPDLENWPRSWSVEPRDIEPGQCVVTCFKPFLLHPLECVRNFAGQYFYNLNYQPPGLVDLVFKAMDKYGDRTCIGLLTSARQYTWSEEQLLALLDRAAATGTAMSDRFNVLGRQYEFLLLNAPPSFFEEHKSKILHDCSFSEMNRKILERFFAMRQINIDT